MAKKTNQYELALSVFYYRNPIFLNNQLGCKLSQIEIEKRFGSRIVDLYAIDQLSDAKVFIEYQINPSDSTHLEQIKSIIQSEGSNNLIKVVWVATSFKQEHLEQVKRYVIEVDNRVEFYAFIVNETVISSLKMMELNNKYEDRDNIDSLNEVSDHLQTAYVYKTSEVDANNLIVKGHSDFKKQVLEQIIAEMRNQLSWYLPVFLSKSVQGNRFSLGAGVSDVTYVVGINRHNALYVQITFSKSRFKLYKKVQEHRKEIDNMLDYRTYWDDTNRRINTTYLLQGHIENNIGETVRLLEKYVRCFNQYI